MSRDNSPHNHNETLIIYNLEPSYNVLIDLFAMPPFQEILNMRNLNTTTLVIFVCIFKWNEQRTSYYDLLKVFDINDGIKNEKFIDCVKERE